MKFTTIINNKIMEMKFSPSMDKVEIKHKKYVQDIDCVSLSANSYSLIINGQTYYLTITPHTDSYEVTVDHHIHIVQVKDDLEILLEKLGIQRDKPTHIGIINAQIPGLVNQIFVKTGNRVEIGEKLCILEAMKMENEITSPLSGIVKNIHIESGSNVDKGDLLMVVEE